MKYYKCLSLFKGRLYSAVQNRYAIEYHIDSINKPKIKGSKLFVFDSLEHAKNWIRDSDIIIVEVSVDNPTKCPSIVKVNSGLPEVQFESYWNGTKISNWNMMPSPLGTTLCDSLKLIKPVVVTRYVVEHLYFNPDMRKWLELYNFIKPRSI